MSYVMVLFTWRLCLAFSKFDFSLITYMFLYLWRWIWVLVLHCSCIRKLIHHLWKTQIPPRCECSWIKHLKQNLLSLSFLFKFNSLCINPSAIRYMLLLGSCDISPNISYILHKWGTTYSIRPIFLYNLGLFKYEVRFYVWGVPNYISDTREGKRPQVQQVDSIKTVTQVNATQEQPMHNDAW